MDRYHLYEPEDNTQIIVDMKSNLVGIVDKDYSEDLEFDCSGVKDPKPKRLVILTNQMKKWISENKHLFFDGEQKD